MCYLFSQKPKTLASVCWFITALKGPPLADVRQMALDRLSLQRPHTALLQELKVTVALKLWKRHWRKENSDETGGDALKRYRKRMRGWRNWSCNEWTNKGTTLPFLTLTSATHQHVPDIPTDYASSLYLSFFKDFFLQLSAPGRDFPWVSVSCTVFICLHKKFRSDLTVHTEREREKECKKGVLA